MGGLSIIIVNFSSSDYIIQCLRSLGGRGDDIDIIVYDNGPTDDGLVEIHKEYPKVKIISPERDVSFAAANNAGAKQAAGDILLFLNPDTKPSRVDIEKLVSFINSRERCGVVGPKLVDGDGMLELSHGADPGILSEARTRLFHKLPGKLVSILFRSDKTQNVDWVSGAAMMIRRDVFESVGGFDESYPLYFEDADLCRRIRNAGRDIYYYPDSEIIHYRGRAGGVREAKKQNRGLSPSEKKYRVGQLRYYSRHRGKLQNSLLKFYLRNKLGTEYDSLGG